MCEPEKGFKFCTCSPSDIDPSSRWVLYRGKGKSFIVGKIHVGLLGGEDSSFLSSLMRLLMRLIVYFISMSWFFQALALTRRFITVRRILRALNSGRAFDFDYRPEVDDALEITLENDVFEFMVSPKLRWKKKNVGDYFSRIKFRMKAIRIGRVQRP